MACCNALISCGVNAAEVNTPAASSSWFWVLMPTTAAAIAGWCSTKRRAVWASVRPFPEIFATANAAFAKVNAGDPKAIYAYTRQKGNQKILVVLNLSGQEQTITLTDKSLLKKVHNVFKNTQQTLTAQPQKLKPWGYEVYEY